MSRIKLEVNVDEYICDPLDQMRKMNKTRDYSSLPALIERIQIHADAMEAALWDYKGKKGEIKSIIKDGKTAQSDKLIKIQEVWDDAD